MTKPTLDHLLEQRRKNALQIKACIDEMNESELSDEFQLATLQSLFDDETTVAGDICTKVDSYICVIKLLEANVDYYKKQKLYYATHAQRYQEKADAMRERIKQVIIASGSDKFPTLDYPNLRLQNASIPSVIIDDAYKASIPTYYWREMKPSQYVDKTLVKQAILKGDNIPFATLEVSKTLRF